jgi:hypothetical protein
MNPYRIRARSPLSIYTRMTDETIRDFPMSTRHFPIAAILRISKLLSAREILVSEIVYSALGKSKLP